MFVCENCYATVSKRLLSKLVLASKSKANTNPTDTATVKASPSAGILQMLILQPLSDHRRSWSAYGS
jgi:hypothetical protein